MTKRGMTVRELQAAVLRHQLENLESTLWWTTEDEELEGIKQMIQNSPYMNQNPVIVIEAVQRRRAAA